MSSHVIIALGEIGDPIAYQDILDALKSKNAQIRSSSASALGKLAVPAAIPALLKALEDKDIEVRWEAIEALGMIGKVEVSLVTSALMETLRNDENIGARRLAASALGKIGDRVSVPALMEAIRDKDEAVRSEAVSALKQLGMEISQ